jgi:iron(III) transport system permease protein
VNLLRRYDLSPLRLLFLAVLACFAAVFLFYPLAFTLAKAFYVTGKSGNAAFTFSYFALMLTDPANWDLIINSINLAIAVTAITTLVAVPMAWVMTRYQFPLKGLMTGLILVPMVLPPFVGAVGMKQMFARFGSINLLLTGSGITSQPVDWLGGGFWAVVILEVLHLYPIMYMSVAAAMANIDPNMEEAARNCGASGMRLFRRITWPLMLPGYFAGAIIVFIWAFTDLGTPLILDYRNLIPVRIFNMLTDINQNPMGYCLVVFMVLMTAGFFYLSKVTLGSQGYAMITRGHVTSVARPAGRLGSVLILMGLGLVTFLAIIPHISVVLTSISQRWFMTILPTEITGKYYLAVFQQDMTWLSIKNSLFLSSLSTVVDILLGISIAWMLLRTRIPFKNVIDTLTMMPLAIPGIIMAFGYLTAFANTPIDATVNPIPLLVIGYAFRRLPYMVRAAYAGFQQTSITLEEAARNVGAGPMTTLRRITLPLVVANLIAGAILCFSFAMLEVSDSLILAAKEKYYPITKAIYALFARPDGAFIASAMGVLGMILLTASLIIAGRFLGKRMGELFKLG